MHATGGLALLAAALGFGCTSGGGAGGAAARTRDSAGVHIVENSGEAWGRGQGWIVADTPLVDIGGKGGDPAYELEQVIGPVRWSDGRLAIALPSSGEVRIYDAKGVHLRSTGQRGSGPGEFQNIAGLWLGPGDSLLVSDPLARRLTVLDREGNLGRTISLAGQGGFTMGAGGSVSLALAAGWFADGSVLALLQGFRINDPRQGPHRDTIAFVRYAPDGSALDTIGRFPGMEMDQMTITFGARSVAAPSPVPLGRQTASVVRGERVYLARNEAWEIEVRSGGGSLTALFRADVKPAPVTAADAEASRKELGDALDGQPMLRAMPEAIKTQMKQRIESARYPETFPFVLSLLADTDGNLWVEEPKVSGTEQRRFAVVDSAGRLLGRVTLPPRFKPAAITHDAVFGVWTDPDDVQHLRGYPLRKP